MPSLEKLRHTEINKYYKDEVFGDVDSKHILVKIDKDSEDGLSDEEAKKLAKEAEARAKEAEARAEKAEATANEGQDIVQKIENKIDECTKETEAYDSMANRFTKEGDGFHNYQRKHGKEIPYAQHIVTELENKLRNGEGNKYELMAELNIARKDLKQKEELYANAEEERRTCKTAATRALKEANSIRNGELRDAENDLRTIKNILAKY